MSNLFSFTGQSQQDPNQQVGYNQYIQQGQNLINPGQAQIAQSNPVAAAGIQNLAQAFQKAQQNAPQLPAQITQNAMAQGAVTSPNVNGQNMGGVGPTVQNAALARGLMLSNGGGYNG